MAHPNLQTNGASLEDCHTNFFALTDLCGIRWRKLTSEGYTPQPTGPGGVYGGQQGMRGMPGSSHHQPWDYLNDPVLSSYWRCLSNDILCVWRRIPTTSASSPSAVGGNGGFPPQFGGAFPGQPGSSSNTTTGLHTLSGAKELWIFWYGDTSPDLTNLVVPELLNQEGDQGSWENGLSYECRSLLFKALHNLIERCLLSRDFIRLGKWFVQPQEGLDMVEQQHQQQQQQEDGATPGKGFVGSSSSHLSFSFSFFVHGESTVCASIDVRQHPVVRKVTQRHLAAAQASNGGVHVLLAPYGLAGILTGASFRASSDHTTRKLMDEWRQYYPVEGPAVGQQQQQRGPGPGGGTGSLDEVEDMVEIIIGQVRTRYPACFVLVCDTDSVANASAFQQLAASEGGGMLMTPPSSPPLSHTPVSHPVGLTRSLSHSGPAPATTSINNSNQQQLLIPTVPSSTAAAIARTVQSAHSWRPQDAGRLGEQAWEDSLLSPAGLAYQPRPSDPSSMGGDVKDPLLTANLWDFVDPTVKNSCSCAKSRRNNRAAGSSSSSSSISGLVLGTCSSSSSSSSSSSNPSVVSMTKKGTPYHLRPTLLLPVRSTTSTATSTLATATCNNSNNNAQSSATKDVSHHHPSGVSGSAIMLDGFQDRANRPGTTGSSNSVPSGGGTSSGGTPTTVAPVLPTYQRSQAALRGNGGSWGQQHSVGPGSALNSSVGAFLASPASVAPSPLATPHSQPPSSVPPLDTSLPASSPLHPPASNDPVSNFIPSTPSAADQHQPPSSHDASGSKTTPGGACHTPGGPKSNAAYSPYVAIPSVDTPGWPHSTGPAPRPAPPCNSAPTSVAPPTLTTSSSAGGSGNGNDPTGIRGIVLPLKEYEEELKEEVGSGPGLLYDYSSMTAWLFHPVKRMKLDKETNNGGSDRSADGSTSSAGKHVNGGMMDGMDTGEFEEDGTNNQSRKRKEPDSKDDDSLNAANVAAAKPVNPTSLFTSEGLQASYQDLDKIFDNSDESNDTCPVPTPPGSNKPSGMPEDTALMGGKPRITPAHSSPGGGMTTLGGQHNLTAGGVNILASAELSKMFPTPPSHEHPMQSPCGQLEGSTDMMTGSDMILSSHNGIKSEPSAMNGCSPTYMQEDNKDCSYVYKPPTLWRVANSSKYAPLSILPSQTMPALCLPAPYRPSPPSSITHSTGGEIVRPAIMMPGNMRPFPRPMVPTGPHPFGPMGRSPFSPISPSPYLDGGVGPPPSFSGPHHGLQRPGMSPMGFAPPHNTLKQLLQHQQHPNSVGGQQFQQQSPLPQHHPVGGGPFAHHPQHHHPHHPPQQQLQIQAHHNNSNSNVGHSSHANLPECHSLMLNIVLGDSMLNVFRDHNFDSCVVCVCSDGQNWVGTIRGPDAVYYLPVDSSQNSSRLKALPAPQQQQFPGMGPGFMQPPGNQGGNSGGQQEEESCRCNCGFSALVNRRLAHQAGLFYEDEVEISGAQSTQDPAQFKRGSLYAFCHSEKEEQLMAMTRSRLFDMLMPGQGTGGALERVKTGKMPEKYSDKDDRLSNTIAAVVREATAPTVDTLPVALMELLREQCLLIHHSSNPLYRAEQLQAAVRKPSILHALDLADSCDTARNALNLALYTSSPPVPGPLTSPMHPQQGPPPPYQQQQSQQWNSCGPPTPNPYGMPFNHNMGGGGPPGGPGPFPGGNPNMHHPMSPSLHSPGMSVRGRPPTPSSAMGMGGLGMGMPMGMTSPTGPMGMQMQRPPQSSSASSSAPPPPPPAGPIVHYWPFLHVQGPGSSYDIIRVMRTLQPLLQDSIQKKRAASLWRAPFAVQGPLTWRQFHRMAVRGTEDRCEPQPIPSVMAGFDRDWVAIAPLAIPHWDRLLLEPYSRPRDVAYIVLAPDVDYVLQRTKLFFRELSSVYEMCRFGRHVPVTKGLRDGILRVGKSASAKLANDPIDDWFTNIGDSPVASLLRLYAKVCRYHLAPTLINLPMDRTLLDPPAPPARPTTLSGPVPSPMAPPSTTPMHSTGDFSNPAMGPPNPTASNMPHSNPAFGHPSSAAPSMSMDASGKPTSPKTESSTDGDGSSGSAHPSCLGDAADDENAEPPSIVVYIVDPFSFASDSLDLGRLTTLGLLRCYHQMLSLLSESTQLNVSLQLVTADSIMQLGKDFNGAHHTDSLRSLALNVFSQCKKFPLQPSNVKSLTGFGPAAASDSFLKAKDEKNRAPYRVYVPAYVLAPMKDRTVCDLDPSVATNGGPTNGLVPSLAVRPDKFAVLYVSYCLSEDQRWLVASCTDERGELVDSCTIGIDVPNRTKRKRVCVRRFALQRLMDFILGVISTGVHPWRLVIGRLGRMGHGELKSWSALLSRKNLLRASRHLAEICNQCSLSFPSQAPTLVSACLVSLEPDSHFRMMPDQVTPDERFGQQSANSHLSTPEDASCTHILVFPTSATTRSPQTTFHEENINGPDLGDDDLLSALNDDMGDGFEGMSGFDDIFMTWPENDPVNDATDDLTSDLAGVGNGGMNNMGGCGTSRSPGAAHGPPSPSGRGGMRGNMPGDGSPSGGVGSGRQSPRAEQEEVGTLLQQPLALGYYVSTAPTGDMPAWFWASCPHLARSCPAFLKCALHLHNHTVQQSSDDLLLQQNNSSKAHPLDSQVTTDVLRYVMEGYNALSWLALDPKSRDRRSCLPIHIQLLVQLYHALSALV